jgi:predicted transcriptional regulator
MNELLNVISASDKRRNLMVLLNSGPKEWDDIKQILKVTSTGMLPQVKILEEEHLIERDGRRFSLTPMGKVIATRMEPLIRTMEVFDKNRKFWQDHNIGVLPHELLLDIGELGDYKIVEIPDEDLFNINPFLANLTQAKSIRGITHTVHPKFPEFFTSLARNGIQSTLIFTPNVFKIVAKDYPKLLGEYLGFRNASLYVCKENLKFSFALVIPTSLSPSSITPEYSTQSTISPARILRHSHGETRSSPITGNNPEKLRVLTSSRDPHAAEG